MGPMQLRSSVASVICGRQLRCPFCLQTTLLDAHAAVGAVFVGALHHSSCAVGQCDCTEASMPSAIVLVLFLSLF
jgi:hypothetical protein